MIEGYSRDRKLPRNDLVISRERIEVDEGERKSSFMHDVSVTRSPGDK